MRILIPKIIGWIILAFIGIFFLLAGFSFFMMASDTKMPVLCILASLFCIGCCVFFVAISDHRKFLGSLLGTSLFAMASGYLYLVMTWEISNRDQELLYAAGFMLVYGLPGLFYIFKYRFDWSSLKPLRVDLNEITELLDTSLARADSTTERFEIMGEILQRYEAYHRVKGGDEMTWRRIASILEDDYDTYKMHVDMYRQDYEENPINYSSITTLVRELSAGGPIFPVIQGGSGRLGAEWVASFRGTASELLSLEQKRYRKTRTFVRYVLWSPIFLAVLWIISVVLDIQYKSLLLFWALPVYLQAIYADLIRPLIVRRQIRKDFPPHGEIEIEVNPEGFLYRTYSSSVNKKWDDLSEASTAKFGIELRWKDGTKHWLPEHLADSPPEPAAVES